MLCPACGRKNPADASFCGECAAPLGEAIDAPLVHLERAALARLASDEATRQRGLREAHRLFVEMGATARAEQVARELAARA